MASPHRPPWMRAPRCCAALVLAAWSWASPPVQAHPSVSASIEASLSTLVHEPLPLGRTAISATDPLPPIPFPSQFRHDPLAGMVALEHWEAALRRSRKSAATVLHQTLALALAYASPLWSEKKPAVVEAEKKAIPAAQAVAWPADLPAELRGHIAPLLDAIAQAQTWRRQALAPWPSEVSAADLWSSFGPLENRNQDSNRSSTPVLLNSVDQHALAHGIWQLTAAVEQTAQALERSRLNRKTVPGAWRFGTPWGEVIVDTTPTNNHYRGQQPLLLIDTAGNDSYAFDQERPPGVTVLLDLAGNDRYQGGGLGRDPSGATLGYAVLLDASGDDLYEGQWLTQGAALFGAAVLIDRGGQDRYQAQGQAQGFALGGVGVLLDFDGDDRYQALTQAQASAGPGALALLFDRTGNDRYVLANTPLVLPSAQLKNSNASLGQGTAFGLRSKADDRRQNSAGGLALLLDAQGDDVYEAQVFAQGAGYEGGMGVLWDGGGSDQMQAAWYALGAAAHGASGVFVAGGSGQDVYTVSHATSLGAAHDESVGIFVGGLGDDGYSLSTLGLGAAHDSSTALFVERAGNDRYQHTHPLCRGFGASVYSEAHAKHSEPTQTRSNNIVLFIDQGGTDRYPTNCTEPSNGLRWSIGDAETGFAIGQDHTNRPPSRKKALASPRAHHPPR